MSIALGALQHALELLDERLSLLRVGPAQQLLGFLPRQREAVQGSTDRLAAAHKSEPLAGPADQGRKVQRGAGSAPVRGGVAAVRWRSQITSPSSAWRH